MKNEDVIKKYLKYCKANLAPATLTTYKSFITLFSKRTNKDFNDVTRDDIENYYEEYFGAKSSKEAFKKFIKTFYKWIHDQEVEKEIQKVKQKMEEQEKSKLDIEKKVWEIKKYRPKYPMVVDWIKPKPVRTSKTEKDCLNPEQVIRLINACNNAQHKALVSYLWDVASRIGQATSINIGDLIIKDGKLNVEVEMDNDERRVIPTVDSTQYIFNWLNEHPYKDQPGKPLFISLSPNSYGKRLSPNGFYYQLQTLAKRANIRQHITPHTFRHSRTTFWKRNNVNSDAIKYIGLWKMNSQIPDTVYNHTNADDYRNIIIEQTTGIKQEFKPIENPMIANYCSRCGERNTPTAEYCVKCKEPLSKYAKQKQDEIIKQQIADQVKQILKRETEPEVRTYEIPIEQQSHKELIKTGVKPIIETVVLPQAMPSQEELFEKYKQLERIVAQLKQQ